MAVERRFYLLGEARPSSLVPDVAFVSYARLPRSLPSDARERPPTAPDIAVEIRSPGDHANTLEAKIELYLAHGSAAVIVVDPEPRSVEVFYPGGTREGAASGAIAVRGFDGLTIDVAALFADI